MSKDFTPPMHYEVGKTTACGLFCVTTQATRNFAAVICPDCQNSNIFHRHKQTMRKAKDHTFRAYPARY